MRLSAESANLEFDSGTIGFNNNTPTSVAITTTLNLRTALGDMYNKYNKFLMIFNAFGGFAGQVTYSGNPGSSAYTVGISGDLQFLSNTVNGQISNIGYFPTRFSLPNNGTTFTNSTTENGIVFMKPANDVVTFIINPYLVRGGAVAIILSTTGNTIYDFNYSFTVYGLSE